MVIVWFGHRLDYTWAGLPMYSAIHRLGWVGHPLVWTGHDLGWQWSVLDWPWAAPELGWLLAGPGLGYPLGRLAVRWFGHGVRRPWAGLSMGLSLHGVGWPWPGLAIGWDGHVLRLPLAGIDIAQPMASPANGLLIP
jgi:hypothetical protein